MKPTNKLRYIERTIDTSTEDVHEYEVHRILQQWWEDNSTDIHWVNGNPGEWRDVPLEKEA